MLAARYFGASVHLLQRRTFVGDHISQLPLSERDRVHPSIDSTGMQKTCPVVQLCPLLTIGLILFSLRRFLVLSVTMA